MKTKIITAILTVISLFSTMMVSTTVYATENSICNQKVAEEVKAAAGCSNASTSTGIETVIQNILNVVIGLLGIVAVVFIIIGGVQYMTSTGDAGKTKKARDTILYATIGLVICAFAAVITNFTINAITKAQNSTNKTSFITTNLS